MNPTITSLLEHWRKTKDDQAAKVYRDACFETGLEPIVKSLVELKAKAAEALKPYPQYDGCHDSVTLVRVKEQVVTKMGRAFAKGEISIAQATRDGEAADGSRVSVWSPSNGIHTSLFESDVEELPGNFAEQIAPPPMKPVKVELKKFSANERLSEETLAFTADVYVNGKRAGYASNHGTGGMTDVHLDKANNALVEAYVSSLPPVVSEHLTDPKDETKPFTYYLRLDSFIDQLADALHRVKHEALAKKRWARFAAKAKTRGFIAFVTRCGHPTNYSEVLFEVRKAEDAKTQAEAFAAKRKAPMLMLQEVSP